MADNRTTVRVTADASGYTAELDRAAKSAQAFTQTQQQSAARVAAAQRAIAEAATNGSSASARAINAFVSQVDRAAQSAGKTQAQMLSLKAAQLGVSDSVSGYISAIEQASEHQHQFALNTSASRRELLVLAHEASQGSWTRFGGSLLVLGEQMDLMRLAMSPLGVGLIAAGGAAYLFAEKVHQGAEQAEAFNKAIASTGGYLGLSTEQLIAMSNGIGKTNADLTQAREALAQVASTGAFTADSLQLATRAALAMSADIGIGTDKAAESLAKIQDDVLKWVADYQKSHHTFNAAQIEEIDNFVRMGDTTGAYKAVLRDLVAAHEVAERSGTKATGFIAQGWHDILDVVSMYKNAIMNLGVPDGITKQVGDQLARVEAAQRSIDDQRRMGNTSAARAAMDQLAVEQKKLDVLRDQQAEQFKATRAREAAAKSGDQKIAVDDYVRKNKYAGPSQKRDQDLTDENEAFAKATANLDKNSKDYQTALKQHYAAIQEINDQYSKKTKAHGNGSEAFHGALTAMIAANQLIEAEEKRSQTALKVQYDAGLIDREGYFQKLHDLQAKATDEEIANAQKRVDIAKSKPESSAYQEALKTLQNLTATRKQIDQTLTDNLRGLAAQRSSDITRFAEQEASALRRTQAAQQQVYATMFLAPDAKAQADAAYQLLANFEAEKEALRQQYDSPTADQAEYQAKLAIAQSYYDASVAQLQDAQAKQMAIRQSYADQMRLAMVSLAGTSQTNAEIAASAFSKSFEDMNTALEEFVTTGKFSFSSFATSVLSDLSKIALKAAESQIFNTVLGGSFFSSGGPVGHFADGGHISGAGTGTSDSIPAMLSNGEFVVNAAATSKHRSLLEAINSGHAAHFATGGPVGSSGGGGNSGGSPVSVTVHNNGGNGLTNEDAKELHAMVSAFVDKRITQRFRGQGGLMYQMKYGQA